jgi:L-alanine-DL-glutamate epimerase-like enolase superfamily enzyme
MKIVAVEPLKLRFTPAHGLADGLAPIASREVFLVRVSTDAGLVGIGEGFALGCLDSAEALLNETVTPLLLGEDAFLREHLWDKVYRNTYRYGRRGLLPCVLSAVDIALWDIAGKAAGLPVYRLLGGAKDRVPAYASGGYYAQAKTLDDLTAEAVWYRAQGFKTMKMKIGAEPLDVDCARVGAVRAAIGDSMGLAVDANNAYDFNTALRMCRMLEPLNLCFFEEPLSGDSIEDSIRLAGRTDIPIAGYETELTRFALRDFITRRAVDIVQTDAIWAGGISEARNIALLAAAWKMICIPHFSAGVVSLAANLHLAGALVNVPLIELTLDENPLRDRLARTPIGLADGFLALPQAPGLGIDIDDDVVLEFKVK